MPPVSLAPARGERSAWELSGLFLGKEIRDEHSKFSCVLKSYQKSPFHLKWFPSTIHHFKKTSLNGNSALSKPVYTHKSPFGPNFCPLLAGHPGPSLGIVIHEIHNWGQRRVWVGNSWDIRMATLVDPLGPIDDSAFVARISQHQSVDDSSKVAKSRLIIRAKGVVDLLNSSIHSWPASPLEISDALLPLEPCVVDATPELWGKQAWIGVQNLEVCFPTGGFWKILGCPEKVLRIDGLITPNIPI